MSGKILKPNFGARVTLKNTLDRCAEFINHPEFGRWLASKNVTGNYMVPELAEIANFNCPDCGRTTMLVDQEYEDFIIKHDAIRCIYCVIVEAGIDP